MALGFIVMVSLSRSLDASGTELSAPTGGVWLLSVSIKPTSKFAPVGPSAVLVVVVATLTGVAGARCIESTPVCALITIEEPPAGSGNRACQSNSRQMGLLPSVQDALKSCTNVAGP